MRIICVGVNHKTADVAVRERVAFDENDAYRALRALRDEYGDSEFVVLGTCNRSELYCARPVHGHPRESEMAEFFGRFHGLPSAQYADSLYTFVDDEAVRHLFQVACGLDSMVLGESQIAGQVKAAYQLAAGLEAVGPTFNQLFQLALSVGKQVQRDTGIGNGRVSVAGAAIDFAAREVGRFEDKRVLSVGAGKMNALMLDRLRELGCRRFDVVNRSPDKARPLAEKFGAAAEPLANLAARLAEADVVVASTGATDPLITRAMVARAMTERPDRPLLILDIAVPRDVEAEVAAIEGVRLYNIDDLDRAVQATLELRTRELDKCEAIIDDRVREFSEWLAAREITPTIEALVRRVHGIAEEELAKARNKLSTHDDADLDEQVVQRTVRRVVQRILHSPTENLRRHSSTESARMYAAVLRKLFDLDGRE